MNRFTAKLLALADLGPRTIEALESATSKPRQYRARQDLIREGDPTGPVFVVLEGWVCRYKILPNGSRQIMAFLMPGDACDLHTELIAEMDHGIQAVTVAEVAVVPRQVMHTLLNEHSTFAKAMYTAQLVDEGTLRSWIVSMGRRSSIERVAHLMCELYLRATAIDQTSNGHLELPLSQLTLADALGMTPVHINRVLKELRLLGAMELKRGALVIQDPTELVRVAGYDENYLHRRLAVGLMGIHNA